MRIRTIKPDFWEHPVMAKQSDATKLLAIGLLNIADDKGYFFADPRMIRNAIRPLDDDSRITTVSLRELSDIGYIEIKNHPTHGDIGFIPSFLNHQVINKAKSSKIKELYEYGINTVSIPYQSDTERKGKERNMEGKGEELSSPSPPTFETIKSFAGSQMYPISDECVESFYDEMEALQWTYKSQPCVETRAWQGRFRKYATNWINNLNAPNKYNK